MWQAVEDKFLLSQTILTQSSPTKTDAQQQCTDKHATPTCNGDELINRLSPEYGTKHIPGGELPVLFLDT